MPDGKINTIFALRIKPFIKMEDGPAKKYTYLINLP